MLTKLAYQRFSNNQNTTQPTTNVKYMFVAKSNHYDDCFCHMLHWEYKGRPLLVTK